MARYFEKNAVLAKTSAPNCCRQRPQPAQHQGRKKHHNQCRKYPSDPPVVKRHQTETLLIQLAHNDAGDQKARNHEENIDADKAARRLPSGRHESSRPASRRWPEGHQYPADIEPKTMTRSGNPGWRQTGNWSAGLQGREAEIAPRPRLPNRCRPFSSRFRTVCHFRQHRRRLTPGRGNPDPREPNIGSRIALLRWPRIGLRTP
jgi:hypothetical protein